MIVVTTPPGAIGRQLLDILVAGGEPVRVIARDPARLPAHVRDHVEVVEGSHHDAAVVNRAFAGADAVFWVPPPNPRIAAIDDMYSGFSQAARAAIKAHGVGHVVTVSALGRGTPWESKAGLVTASLKMDDLFAATGAHVRALVNPSFMDNALGQVEPIRSRGLFVMSIAGDREVPMCATRDIAAMSARLLRDRAWAGQGQVAVLGPEDLSCNAMARIMSDLLGKPIRFQEISVEADRAHMKSLGASDAFADAYAEMKAAKAAGLDNGEPRTAENTTPTGFREWCEAVLKPAVVG